MNTEEWGKIGFLPRMDPNRRECRRKAGNDGGGQPAGSGSAAVFIGWIQVMRNVASVGDHARLTWIDPAQVFLPAGRISPPLWRGVGLALFALVILWPQAVQAQRYRLRDGRVLEQSAVVVRDGRMIISLGDGKAGAPGAEMTLPVSLVVELECPEPEELRSGRAALAAGRTGEALLEADSVVTRFAPFSRVPGSWWAEALVLRVRALAAAGRSEETRQGAAMLLAAAPRADQAALVRVAVAGIDLSESKTDAAGAVLIELLRDPVSVEVEVEGALLLGEVHLAGKEWEKALEAFLRIPAFHGRRVDLMPRVLLGSARAYRGLNDAGRVERTLLELNDRYPEAVQATTAKKEFLP